MVEEILSNIYKIEVPLPGSPKVLNSYLSKAGRETLLLIQVLTG